MLAHQGNYQLKGLNSWFLYGWLGRPLHCSCCPCDRPGFSTLNKGSWSCNGGHEWQLAKVVVLIRAHCTVVFGCSVRFIVAMHLCGVSVLDFEGLACLCPWPKAFWHRGSGGGVVDSPSAPASNHALYFTCSLAERSHCDHLDSLMYSISICYLSYEHHRYSSISNCTSF
jgi:hypothetical protein